MADARLRIADCGLRGRGVEDCGVADCGSVRLQPDREQMDNTPRDTAGPGVPMANDNALREQLAKFLDWRDAHLAFEVAVKCHPPRLARLGPTDCDYSLCEPLANDRHPY